MSRDKTCEARGWGAYQSGVEGCHDEWFQREARIARLCMMFMQDGDGVRSVRKVASAHNVASVSRLSAMSCCTHVALELCTAKKGFVLA